MKKNIIALVIALSACFAAQAQSEFGLNVSQVSLNHNLDDLVVAMQVDLSRVHATGNTAVTFIPTLFNGEQSLALKPIGIYSRGRFYSIAREARTATPFADGDYLYLEREAPANLAYTDEVPYADWMDGAELRIDYIENGCCGKVGKSGSGIVIGKYEEPEPEIIEYVPHYVYVQPDAGVQTKERSISGEAFVIFKSGKTTLEPEYQNNTAELAKIRATIDSVRTDNDITITQIMLRGYSSPEGRYSANEKFARERTEALKKYVSGLYPLPESIWAVESVAENWDGLRAAVEASDALKNKAKILELIDSDLDADRKEAKLKAYSKDYQYLLKNVFPELRRTDYKVSYTIRSYTTAEEVRKMMELRPRNLSIQEFFLAAEGYEPGSEEFNRVFRMAARVYPDDEVANINAANGAMAAGDLERAARYLDRLGDTPVARYTRGVYYALSENFEKALDYFRSAEVSGLNEAAGARSLVELIIEQRKTLK